MEHTFEVEKMARDVNRLGERLEQATSLVTQETNLDHQFDAYMRERCGAPGTKEHGFKCNDELAELVLQCGISGRWRKVLWWEWSGAKEEMQRSDANYATLLQEAEEASQSKCHGMNEQEQQINLDVERTFPDHPHYMPGGKGLLALRRVLLAFSYHHNHIGYLQGMNCVAGVLLLVFENEQEAFWMLCTFVDRILPPYLSQKLNGLKEELERFSRIVHDELPELHARMAEFGLDTSFIIPKWFICAFAVTLPIPLVLKIWDVLVLVSHRPCSRINGGSKEVAKRCAWALLLSLNKSIVGASTAGEIGEAFREAHSQVASTFLFLQLAFGGPSPTVMRNLCQSGSLTFSGPPVLDSPLPKSRAVSSPGKDVLHTVKGVSKPSSTSPSSPLRRTAQAKVQSRVRGITTPNAEFTAGAVSPFSKAVHEILRLTPKRSVFRNRTNSIPEHGEGKSPASQEGMELEDLSGSSPPSVHNVSAHVARSLKF